MPRNQHFKIIWNWIKSNSSIQIRKYYSAQELYEQFLVDQQQGENRKECFTLRKFTLNLNLCVSRWEELNKIEMKRRHWMYIILKQGSNINKNTRISPMRNVSGLSSPSIVPLELAVVLPSPTSTPTKESYPTSSSTKELNPISTQTKESNPTGTPTKESNPCSITVSKEPSKLQMCYFLLQIPSLVQHQQVITMRHQHCIKIQLKHLI